MEGMKRDGMTPPRLSREGGNPEMVWERDATCAKRLWIPAFAGKTGWGWREGRDVGAYWRY